MRISLAMGSEKKRAEMLVTGLSITLAKHLVKVLMFPEHRDTKGWLKDATNWAFDCYDLGSRGAVKFDNAKFNKYLYAANFVAQGRSAGLRGLIEDAIFSVEGTTPAVLAKSDSELLKKFKALFEQVVPKLGVPSNRQAVKELFATVKTFNTDEQNL